MVAEELETFLAQVEPHAGTVTLIERFGSVANMNIYPDCLVLEGVYRRTEGKPIFEKAHGPDAASQG